MKTPALVALFALAVARAQAPLEFEVASVKANKSGTGVRGGCRGIDSKYTPGEVATAPPLGRCVITDGRLGHLAGIAWDLQSMSLIQGEPDWRRGFDRFNIEAKADNPAGTTEAQLHAMLQALLIERFALKFHRETVMRSGFALVVEKSGPRFKPSHAPDLVMNFGDQGKPAPGRPGMLTARKYPMALLAEIVSGVVQRPVVDKTGLTGDFDFTLNWDEEQGPTIETALQEQLGLKLEPQKVPVKLFVIDSAQKPSPN